MADTTPQSGEGSPGRLPLSAGQIVAAIYRIAFTRPGNHDVFANARVRWFDFIVPVVLFLVLQVGYETQRDAHLAHVLAISVRNAEIILGIITAGILIRLVVATAVTAVLAYGLASRERVGPGLLGYVWMQAVLVAPWVMILRGAFTGNIPVWMTVVLGFGSTLYLIYGASRVLRVAFGLSNIGLGVLFALAGSIVSYAVDRLIPW